VTLEISSLFDVEADIVEYVVAPGSAPCGKYIRDLQIPDGAVVAMIVRDKQLVPPRGSTLIREGDYVFFLMSRDCRGAVDAIFSH
jgi:cell volume regulation protein A